MTTKCVICGVALNAQAAKACAECADDWGAMQRIIDDWRKSKAKEIALRVRVAAVAVMLCEQKGLSETQAAKAIGVSRLTIRAWRGK